MNLVEIMLKDATQEDVKHLKIWIVVGNFMINYMS